MLLSNLRDFALQLRSRKNDHFLLDGINFCWLYNHWPLCSIKSPSNTKSFEK